MYAKMYVLNFYYTKQKIKLLIQEHITINKSLRSTNWLMYIVYSSTGAAASDSVT